MDTLINGLSGLNYGIIWIDVEVYQVAILWARPHFAFGNSRLIFFGLTVELEFGEQSSFHPEPDSGRKEERKNSWHLLELLQLAIDCRPQVRIIHMNVIVWLEIFTRNSFSWCYPEQQGLGLWYAHYDNNPSFSDFTPFGCWSKPNIKQYAGDATECSFSVDKNWYPWRVVDFWIKRFCSEHKSVGPPLSKRSIKDSKNIFCWEFIFTSKERRTKWWRIRDWSLWNFLSLENQALPIKRGRKGPKVW
jgi:hypothetical protein